MSIFNYDGVEGAYTPLWSGRQRHRQTTEESDETMEDIILSFIASAFLGWLIVWGVDNTIRTLHSRTEFGAGYTLIAMLAFVPFTISTAIMAHSIYDYQHPHMTKPQSPNNPTEKAE